MKKLLTVKSLKFTVNGQPILYAQGTTFNFDEPTPFSVVGSENLKNSDALGYREKMTNDNPFEKIDLTDATQIGAPNELLHIDEIYAFIAQDAQGNEGVCACSMPDGWMIPLVGADLARVNQLKPLAAQLAKKTNQQIKLVRFSTRTELETYEP